MLHLLKVTNPEVRHLIPSLLTVTVSTSCPGSFPVPAGTTSSDTIYGTDDFGETINGDNGDDHLFGCGGDDTLNGENGKDVLDGGKGDDILNGGNANIHLLGVPEKIHSTAVMVLTKLLIIIPHKIL